MKKEEMNVIQEAIGYVFRSPYLLRQAFTRRSYSNEHRLFEDNERLEFIGDKILDFIVVKKITSLFGYEVRWGDFDEEEIESKSIPDATFSFTHTEGEMTDLKKQIVQTKFLAKAIERLDLHTHLRMGKGDVEKSIQNEDKVKEDLMEAIIGAIAIDSHWNVAVIEQVVDKLLNLEYHLLNGIDDGMDYVTEVHNWHQKEYKEPPDYDLFYDDSIGKYQCSLGLSGRYCGYFESLAQSKAKAEQLCAKRVYEYIQEQTDIRRELAETVGEFDLECAVSKLNELQQKKLIGGLEYMFYECTVYSSITGNPSWECQCRVDGVTEDIISEICETKAIAKKSAAYKMLTVLTDKHR